MQGGCVLSVIFGHVRGNVLAGIMNQACLISMNSVVCSFVDFGVMLDFG